jgi:hypothetical protein
MLKWVEETAGGVLPPFGSLGRSLRAREFNPYSLGLGTVVSLPGVIAEQLSPCEDFLSYNVAEGGSQL